MPHIFVDKIKGLEFPSSKNGVDFLFQAGELLACKIGSKEFFLYIKQKGDKVLIKYDKITRPLLDDLKKAYKALVELMDVNVVFSNLGEIKEYKKDEYLLNASDDLDFEDMLFEVGFGSGRHLLYLAKNNPEKIVIGVEIHQPSIEQVLKRIKLENLTNVRIINFDARLLLSKMPSNKISGIFVHFPVPWDKKPHRRVISSEFINESIRCLRKNGILHLRTDSDNYFEYSFGEFMKLNKSIVEIKKNKDLEISSKYEDRWKKMEKNIYDIILTNEEISKELELDFDFDFDFDVAIDNFSINKKPYVFDGFVVHFEREFKIDEKTSVIKLTMGAFDRPEHLYLMTGTKPKYINKPLKLRLNYQAHKEIKRLLNGK
jgi:tRNA (guanine-N7-)-methyltransferase